MITPLGTISLGVALPLFNTALTAYLATLAAEIAAVQADVAALTADLGAFQGDLAGLMSELAEPAGMLDTLLATLARGPAAYIQGLNAAIANLSSGLQLAGLLQALTAGPSGFLASIQAAVAQMTGKVAAVQGRIAAMTARVARVQARLDALALRLSALLSQQGTVLGWRSTLAASVSLYRYSGPASQLGSELTGLPTDLAEAIVVVATAPSAIVALGQVFA